MAVGQSITPLSPSPIYTTSQSDDNVVKDDTALTVWFGNRTADQRLCFRYIDSTIPLLPKSEISSIQQSCVIAQPGFCGTWSETQMTGYLTTGSSAQKIETAPKPISMTSNTKKHNRSTTFERSVINHRGLGLKPI